jgi:hypothetical protein
VSLESLPVESKTVIHSLLDVILAAFNADFDRTKLIACRTTTSHIDERRIGVRSMNVNDVVVFGYRDRRYPYIVKDVGGMRIDFEALPSDWERSFNPENPIAHDVVSQCQTISNDDHGEYLWREFVMKVWDKFPHEMLAWRLGHDKPYTDDEVTSIADWIFNDIKPNICMSDEDEKDIRKYLRSASR